MHWNEKTNPFTENLNFLKYLGEAEIAHIISYSPIESYHKQVQNKKTPAVFQSLGFILKG